MLIMLLIGNRLFDIDGSAFTSFHFSFLLLLISFQTSIESLKLQPVLAAICAPATR
jgi:hypothetical protein